MRNDEMPFDDYFGVDSITPAFDSLKVQGKYKLLVVLFLIDCSETMSGKRIEAVNAALQQLKYEFSIIKKEQSLDIKMAIMSFSSIPKWETQLEPIDEIHLKDIVIRPGSTQYGGAFHLLNKVLNRESFMKHTGKIAPPAIMFLTDGKPDDEYQPYLDELLKNPYFVNANRSVILLGDAINDKFAKKAVNQFVPDPNSDIISINDTKMIFNNLKLGTLRLVDVNQENERGYVNPFGNTPKKELENSVFNSFNNFIGKKYLSDKTFSYSDSIGNTDSSYENENSDDKHIFDENF